MLSYSKEEGVMGVEALDRLQSKVRGEVSLYMQVLKMYIIVVWYRYNAKLWQESIFKKGPMDHMAHLNNKQTWANLWLYKQVG